MLQIGRVLGEVLSNLCSEDASDGSESEDERRMVGGELWS